MPSVVRSKMWFVRVDGEEASLKTKLQFMLGWVDLVRVLCLAHDGDSGKNPHVHFVIELTSELQKQSFDKRVKDLFEVTQQRNSSRCWSSKVWDGNLRGGPSYMFHEETERIVINKGFSNEQIQEAKKINSEVKEAVTNAKNKGPGPFVDRVLMKLRSMDTSHHAISDAQIRAIFLRMYVVEVKEGLLHPQPDYKLKTMIDEVVIKYEEDVESLTVMLYDRLFPPARV